MGDTGLFRDLTAAAERFRTKSGGALAALARDKGRVQARDYDYRAAAGRRKSEVKRWVVVSPEFPLDKRRDRKTVVVDRRTRPRKWEVASHLRHSSALLSSLTGQTSCSQAQVSLLTSHNSQDAAELLHQSAQACASLSSRIHTLTQSLQLAIQHFETYLSLLMVIEAVT